MNISEANAELVKLLPRTSFSIDLEMWNHYHAIDNSRNVVVQWKLWINDASDHSSTYSGPSLESVVSQAREGTLKEVDASLEGDQLV